MNLDTTMSVDLSDVEDFVTSEQFTQFLLNNTTEFSTAAFILQVLLDKIEECREEVK